MLNPRQICSIKYLGLPGTKLRRDDLVPRSRWWTYVNVQSSLVSKFTYEVHWITARKARPRPGKACEQPQPSKGKTKIGGSLFITTAQQRQDRNLGSLIKTTAQQSQDQDQEKPVHTNSPAKARPRPREAWAKPKSGKNKTKTGRSLYTTTAQQRHNKDHSLK